MFNFSPEARSALIKAGWYEGRRIDTTPYREHCAKHGFFYGEAADAFLREFGDLDIPSFKFARGIEVNYMMLNPIDGADPDWRENTVITMQNLGKPITVLGNIDDPTIIMSEDKITYADDCGSLYLIAPSPEEAIEAFVHGKKFARVQITDPAIRLPNVQKTFGAFGGMKKAFADGFTTNQPPHASASVPACQFPSITFTKGSIPFVLPLLH